MARADASVVGLHAEFSYSNPDQTVTNALSVHFGSFVPGAVRTLMELIEAGDAARVVNLVAFRVVGVAK